MNLEEIKRRLMKMKALADSGVGGERAIDAWNTKYNKANSKEG